MKKMKAILAVLLVVSFAFFALGSGESSGDDQGNGTASNSVSENKNLGDYSVVIDSCRIAEDMEGKAVVIDSEGKEMEKTAVLKTGCQVNVYNTIDEHYGVFYISVLGDIDADGTVTMGDLLKVRNQILKRANLTELQIFSGDIDNDGNITMGDLLKIRNHILGTKVFE